MIRMALVAVAAFTISAPLTAAPTTMAPDFVKQAGASDLFERTSSALVLKNEKNPKIRDFANMMITDHTKSTADIKAAALSDGLKPMPPKLMPAQLAMVAKLKAAHSADQEKLYLEQQITSHEQTLRLMQTFAKSGDKPALKSVATKIIPVVEGHLTEVKSLAAM